MDDSPLLNYGRVCLHIKNKYFKIVYIKGIYLQFYIFRTPAVVYFFMERYALITPV